jgi:hypothetical protein
MDAPSQQERRSIICGVLQFLPSIHTWYASLADPLQNLTASRSKFGWSINYQSAFDHIRKAFLDERFIANYDPLFPLRINIDASRVAVGAVLYQGTHHSKPTFFFSKTLTPAQSNYKTYDLELLAIVSALRHWSLYLLGNTFEVYADHSALTQLPKSPMDSPRIAG